MRSVFTFIYLRALFSLSVVLQEDCIVICVDWEAGASLPNYVRAAANTRLIGKQLSLLMKNLQDHKNLDLNRVHIIGFSLGAHVSGFAGSELPGLKRITGTYTSKMIILIPVLNLILIDLSVSLCHSRLGLDPAGPLFESQHIKARLDSSDANFVDVIHSNGENLILGGLGTCLFLVKFFHWKCILIMIFVLFYLNRLMATYGRRW